MSRAAALVIANRLWTAWHRLPAGAYATTELQCMNLAAMLLACFEGVTADNAVETLRSDCIGPSFNLHDGVPQDWRAYAHSMLQRYHVVHALWHAATDVALEDKLHDAVTGDDADATEIVVCCNGNRYSCTTQASMLRVLITSWSVAEGKPRSPAGGVVNSLQLHADHDGAVLALQSVNWYAHLSPAERTAIRTEVIDLTGGGRGRGGHSLAVATRGGGHALRRGALRRSMRLRLRLQSQ